MIAEERRRSTRPLTAEEEVFYSETRRRINEVRRAAVLERSQILRLDLRRGSLRPDGTLAYSSSPTRGLTWELFYGRLCGIWAEPRYPSAEALKKHLSPGARGRIDPIEILEYAEALRVPVDMLFPTRSREHSEARYLQALASLSRRSNEDADTWLERIELLLQLDDVLEYSQSRQFVSKAVNIIRQQLFELKIEVGKARYADPRG